MFDFSFGEILIIAIIAVLFLGPDKLPKAFVDIAKFFKAVKRTISDAKDALDREVHINEIKQEALEYKKKFEQGAETIKSDIKKNTNLDELNEILNTPIDEQSSLKSDTKIIKTMEDLEIETEKVKSQINLKPKKQVSKAKITKKPESKTESKAQLKPKTKLESKAKTESKTTKTKSNTTNPKPKKPKKSEK